jgi:DNA-binding NtrC family response regulator
VNSADSDLRSRQHPELAAHLVSALELPPLLDRGDDAVQWARFFLKQPGRESSEPALRLTPEAVASIRRYPWPGNLAELRQRLERAAVLASGSDIGVDDLGLDTPLTDIRPLAEAVEDFRRGYVERVLNRCGGNRTQAARLLGVDVRTIFRMLEKGKRDDP